MTQMARLNFCRHTFRFCVFVTRDHDTNRIALFVITPQGFIVDVRIIGDQCIGGFQNGFGRAIVLLQLDQFQARVINRQAFQVFWARTTPCINGLVIVAH